MRTAGALLAGCSLIALVLYRVGGSIWWNYYMSTHLMGYGGPWRAMPILDILLVYGGLGFGVYLMLRRDRS